MFPDFIPLEIKPMSIFTALILFFMGIGFTAYIWWDKKEHLSLWTYTNRCIKIVRQDTAENEKKIDTLFDKIDNSNNDIADIKSNIATITEAILWIKQYSYKGNK